MILIGTICMKCSISVTNAQNIILLAVYVYWLIK